MTTQTHVQAPSRLPAEVSRPAVSFRTDRALTLGVVHPVSRLLKGRRNGGVPILMYHGISDQLGDRHPYFETNTAPKLFAQHMQYLRENGYSAVDLVEIIDTAGVAQNPAKRVAITFDDGFRNFYTHAFPILAQYGFTATMFVTTGWIGNTRIRFEDREFMTWEEVREIHSHGVRIGSHTISHRELKQLDAADVAEEVAGSKQTIEDKLGSPVISFSYPYAFPETRKRFVRMLRETLERNGYENGVSTIIGTARGQDDRFFLPRLPVNSWDDLPLFRAKLEGSYDWLHAFQRGTKMITESVRR
jgi:peptidoglycan/xylan/chitin deacetylase (PgdA/CDA1 family)